MDYPCEVGYLFLIPYSEIYSADSNTLLKKASINKNMALLTI